jgi:hypothetical protein
MGGDDDGKNEHYWRAVCNDWTAVSIGRVFREHDMIEVPRVLPAHGGEDYRQGSIRSKNGVPAKGYQ